MRTSAEREDVPHNTCVSLTYSHIQHKRNLQPCVDYLGSYVASVKSGANQKQRYSRRC